MCNCCIVCPGSRMWALFSLLPLITLILTLNSGISYEEGSVRSKVTPPAHNSSLNYSLLFIFSCSRSFSLHFHPLSLLLPSNIILPLLFFCVSFPSLPCCSLPVCLNGLGLLSITTALSSAMAVFTGFFSENEFGTG